MPQAIIAGVTSGIGSALAEHLVKEGWQVAGTARGPIGAALSSWIDVSVDCDFAQPESVRTASEELMQSVLPWDALILAPGTMNPIGPFRGVDFEAWRNSLEVNLVSHLRMVHALLGHANSRGKHLPVCIFFAGGGTNSAPESFSAYVVAKIALIKATEMLDAEIPGVRFAILGPGWVRTRIHSEAIEAVLTPISVLAETKRRLESDDFVPMKDVLDAVDWILDAPKDVLGGRNFSVVNDPFDSPEFGDFLLRDPNLYKLRRFGNESTGGPHDK